MAQLVTIRVPDPQDVLDTFGAGALIRIERDTASSFATASELGTVAVVAGTTEYEYRDQTGVAGTHYWRYRFSKATPSVAADYSSYTTWAPGGVWIDLEGWKLWADISASDTTDDDWLPGKIAGVNAELSRRVGMFLGPSTDTTRTFDGDGSRVLWVPGGIRTLTTVETKDQTGQPTWDTVTSGDVVLRPKAWELEPGRPYDRLEFLDVVTGTRSSFPSGYDVVRVTGTFGWETSPADIVTLGYMILSRMANARAAGEAASTPARYIFDDDAEMLERYRRRYALRVV